MPYQEILVRFSRRWQVFYLFYVSTVVNGKTEDHLSCGYLGSAVWVIQVQIAAVVAERVQVLSANDNVHVLWRTVHLACQDTKYFRTPTQIVIDFYLNLFLLVMQPVHHFGQINIPTTIKKISLIVPSGWTLLTQVVSCYFSCSYDDYICQFFLTEVALRTWTEILNSSSGWIIQTISSLPVRCHHQVNKKMNCNSLSMVK